MAVRRFRWISERIESVALATVFVGWFSLGQLGIAATLGGTVGSSVMPARIAALVVGLVGVALAVHLWRQRSTAFRWLRLWMAGASFAFFTLFLAVASSVDRRVAWVPMAIGMLLWASVAWWGVRRVERRVIGPRGVPSR